MKVAVRFAAWGSISAPIRTFLIGLVRSHRISHMYDQSSNASRSLRTVVREERLIYGYDQLIETQKLFLALDCSD